eukprot:jgi/Orpsp1_1/1192203/evm.model.d7180000091361.1
MDLSKDIQDQDSDNDDDSIEYICQGKLIKLNKEESLKVLINNLNKKKLKTDKNKNRPEWKTKENIELAINLAVNKFELPEHLNFLPESSASNSLIEKWGKTPIELIGKGLKPIYIYQKKVGERILQKLDNDASSLFDKGMA